MESTPAGDAGSRPSPRRIAASVAAFAILAAGITAAALAGGSSTPAGAAELEQFSDCAAIEEWTTEVTESSAALSGAGGDMDESAGIEDSAASPAAGASESRSTADTQAADPLGTGGTNTVVEGVDEIDTIDRVGDDHLLVARNGALGLVDLARRTVVSELVDVPFDARVSVDGDLVWVVGTDVNDVNGGTVVQRVTVSGDELVAGDSWTTPGFLFDARRTGDRLHLVAIDYPDGGGVVPFEGGPVPCEEVWHPVDPATNPAATLVATLPAEGPLEPTAAAEIVGAGSNLLVTAESVYIATETWDGQEVSTGLHRFDLDTLTPSGSGSVPGALTGPFAINEYEGHLRVATSLQSFGFAVPVEGDDVAVDVASEPAETPSALAEVFVLDTEGDLDIVGQTGRFGHDGETIHGVRFVGSTAYVVTFLNTDPFWVIDLSDPRAPTVVGELEIPGFSAYLHPVDDGRVVGFGPDGDGRTAARLFDVTDPTAPSIVDEIALGDDSPVAWDHHAYVALEGGRFAVPVNDYAVPVGPPCEIIGEPVPVEPPVVIDPGTGAGTSGSPPSDSPFEPCIQQMSGGAAGVAVLGVAGDSFDAPERLTIETDGSMYAERAVVTPDGSWLILAADRLVPLDGGEPVQLPSDPSGGGRIITD